MKLFIFLAICFCFGCGERGTRKNPILLYTTQHYPNRIDSPDGEVYYKRDPGSSGSLNLLVWDHLLNVRDSVIKDLRQEIDSLKMEISIANQPYTIHDTIDVCNPIVKSIPDGYEQDRIEAQKYLDKWDAMNMRRIVGCPKPGDSPEKMQELINKYLSFRSVQHDQKIFDKEVAEYKKSICK